jgi:hypothetical protein
MNLQLLGEEFADFAEVMKQDPKAVEGKVLQLLNKKVV